MVGIKEIARRANVSISTASYALNGSSKVKPATRERILAIAKELHYTPNKAGRILKKQKTNLIGVYLTNYGGPFYGELVEGITDALHEEGYDVIICLGEKSQLFIPEKMIDGALILDSTFETAQIAEYAERGHQMVVLDRKVPNVPAVRLDNAKGAQLAMETLLEQPREHVYLVSGPVDSFDSLARLKAAQDILHQLEMPYSVLPGLFTKDSGKVIAQQIVETGQKNSAIFSLNDEMAVGMYSVFREAKWEVGRDIQIVGFDNIDISHYLQPRLTTIAYSKYEWGKQSAQTLAHLLSGETVEDQVIAVSLKKGKSVE